jgi:hypothetical protein
LEDRLAGGVAAACVLVAQGGLGGCRSGVQYYENNNNKEEEMFGGSSKYNKDEKYIIT